MKKFGIFMCSLALVGMMFTSCDQKGQGGGGDIDIDNLVEDGFYAVGEACPIKDVNASNAVLAQMSQGINEVDMNDNGKTWDESKRDGMWEKYIWLEANKEFELILKEGEKTTIYGANLEQQELTTDGSPLLGYKGSLVIGQKMQVTESGLYHIVLDLNKDGKLDLTGKEQIIVAPVTWGISGDCNGWGMTETTPDIKSATEIVWTWENQEFSAGGKFKFKDAKSSWKIVLDDAGAVKAHTNLGTDSKNGGADIIVEASAIYTIKLTYTLAKGEIANSYKYELIKTADVTAKDYSACVLELVGDAIAEQEGAVADASSWGWGNVYSMGTPSVSGKIYTWNAVGVKLLAAGGFKARTEGAQAQGDIAAFDLGLDGGNATVAADGLYVVTVTIDAATDVKTLTITPYDPSASIVVKAKMPASAVGPFNAWVWPTGGDGAWATLTQEGDWYVYTADAGVTEVNIIFIEGTDWNDKKWQTGDLKTVSSVCWQVEEDYTVTNIDCE
jgi:hypothetical protein